MHFLARIGAALAFSVAAGMAAHAAVLEVGEGKQYENPSDAIKNAADGDTVRIHPGEYFDCAFVTQKKLTIEGVNPDASAVMSDKPCGGKALLVISGSDITLRNLTLTRARVADNNGAGIRAEGMNLTVENVKFINNQNGILAAPAKDSTIIVRNSEFIRNGYCSPCAHGIYVNALKLLRVENSKFFETRQAHHLKSRAARTEVIGNEFRDGPNGTASYHIEAPNGGTLIVRNNVIVKGPKAENRHCAIMIGSEGVNQATREITIEGNSFTNEGSYDTLFVDNRTATEASLKGNKIAGRVPNVLRGDGEVR